MYQAKRQRMTTNKTNNIKLRPIAEDIVVKNFINILTESISSDAKQTQTKLKNLANELGKDGEDINSTEVQAAMLSALIDADGKVEDIDVSDIDSIKKEIKESRGYLTEETGIIHTIEPVISMLGNSAFIHVLTDALHKVGLKNITEEKLKFSLEKLLKQIKSLTGLPVKTVENAFTWIAKKFGASYTMQKITGVSSTWLLIVVMFAISIVTFPGVTSIVAFTISLTSIIGKSFEIIKLTKEIIHHIKEHQDEIKSKK